MKFKLREILGPAEAEGGAEAEAEVEVEAEAENEGEDDDDNEDDDNEYECTSVAALRFSNSFSPCSCHKFPSKPLSLSWVSYSGSLLVMQ